MRRREFIGLGLGGVAAAALGGVFWDDLFGSASAGSLRRGRGYGPLGAPDENGVRLPEGFRSRIVARGEQPVAGTGYRWHLASDGMATFPDARGGFVLVSNSETIEGGASAILFDRAGEPRDAYRILAGTTQNCSGGATPWGSWLSCEEVEDGRVWECDPAGRERAVAHPAMGVFKHESAAVDARRKHVYLTEDLVDGGLYRYTPRRWPDLSAGPARDRARGFRRTRGVAGAAGSAGATRAHAPAGERRHSLQARGGPLARRRHALPGDHGRPPRARLRRRPRADPRGLRRPGFGTGAPAARRPAHGLARRRGVRMRGHRYRRGRHGSDRPGPRGCEVPFDHRSPAPRLGADRRDIRSERLAHVRLLPARLRQERPPAWARGDLRADRPVSRGLEAMRQPT